MRTAIQGFAEELEVLDSEGISSRAALVRVSTMVSVLSELDTPDYVRQAADRLFVNRGWTALWDGVRVGNEILQEAAELSARKSGQLRACVDFEHNAIVVFTDGYDNNSSDEYISEDYPGDGIDTQLQDLFELNIFGVPTPVYAIGVGTRADIASLETPAIVRPAFPFRLKVM